MGNRAKRALIGKLLKERGVATKLYRGNKFSVFRHVWYKGYDKLIELLRLAPGQTVHEASGNHVIKKFPPGKPLQRSLRVPGKNKDLGHLSGYLIRSGFPFEFEDGSTGCTCGCQSPGISRDKLEKSFMEFYLRHPQLEKTLSRHGLEQLNALHMGEHIYDEHGILLAKWLA